MALVPQMCEKTGGDVHSQHETNLIFQLWWFLIAIGLCSVSCCPFVPRLHIYCGPNYFSDSCLLSPLVMPWQHKQQSVDGVRKYTARNGRGLKEKCAENQQDCPKNMRNIWCWHQQTCISYHKEFLSFLCDMCSTLRVPFFCLPLS